MIGALLIAAVFIVSVRSDLKARLEKIKFGESGGPLLASVSHEYPKFTDIICEPSPGRKG